MVCGKKASSTVAAFLVQVIHRGRVVEVVAMIDVWQDLNRSEVIRFGGKIGHVNRQRVFQRDMSRNARGDYRVYSGIVPAFLPRKEGRGHIERGIYRGFGFCARETPGDQLLKHIAYRADNKDVRRILMRYLISG